MSLPAAVVDVEQLRCHSCGRFVGLAPSYPVKLVGLFRASAVGQIGPTHTEEIRRRCRACGWVNMYHPFTLPTLLLSIEPHE